MQYEKKKSQVHVHIKDWTFASRPSAPEIRNDAASEQQVEILYKSRFSPDGFYSPQVPEYAGRYCMKVIFHENDEYARQSAECSFVIHKARFAPDGHTLRMAGQAVYGKSIPHPYLHGYAGIGKISFWYRKKGETGQFQQLKNLNPYSLSAGWYEIFGKVDSTDNSIGAKTPVSLFEIKRGSARQDVAIYPPYWTYGTYAPDEIEYRIRITSDARQKQKPVFSYRNLNDENSQWQTTPPADAGDYVCRISLEQTENYCSADLFADFSIHPALCHHVRLQMENDGFVYGQTPGKLLLSGYEGDGDIHYVFRMKGGSLWRPFTGKEQLDSGEYEIQARIDACRNFVQTRSNIASFTVQKAPADLEFDISDWTFGQAYCISVEKSSTYAFQNVTMRFKNTESAKNNWTSRIPEEAGTYEVEIYFQESRNYLEGVRRGTFAIHKAQNYWKHAPSMPAEIACYQSLLPSGEPRYGDLHYKFYLASAPGDELEFLPSQAGKYLVHMLVKETRNYTGLEVFFPFELKHDYVRMKEELSDSAGKCVSYICRSCGHVLHTLLTVPPVSEESAL